MQFFLELIHNRVLLAAISGWVAAQALKVVFHFLIEQEWDFKRFFGLGGMPSSHACVVCALATAVGISSGFNSANFAISTVLALVVMTDAAGVRRAAGKQAVVINRIAEDLFEKQRGFSYERLKELLGHSPFEVMIGALIGVLLGFLIM
ncbi:divergent PAP2 family protein [Eubacteriales bacterium OttesenSCG-928-N13]|nr:divergent PAP2 family protein [Eubacteriales bacterium OttesenSCG-928-N13]